MDSVASEAKDNACGLLVFEREAEAESDGCLCGRDGITSPMTVCGAEEGKISPFTLATAASPPHELGDDGGGRYSGGDSSPNAANSGDGVVIRSHNGTDGDGGGLLAERGDEETAHFSPAVFLNALLFNATDANHFTEEMKFLDG